MVSHYLCVSVFPFKNLSKVLNTAQYFQWFTFTKDLLAKSLIHMPGHSLIQLFIHCIFIAPFKIPAPLKSAQPSPNKTSFHLLVEDENRVPG